MISKNDIQSFEALRQTHNYPSLKEIRMRRTMAENHLYDVEMIFRDYHSSNGCAQELRVRWFDVVDVRINNLNESFGPILIQIEDIHAYQLEGVRYRVTDQEDNMFSLLCRDFTFELISRE